MSGTQQQAPVGGQGSSPVSAGSEPSWAKPSIGIYTLCIFVGCLAVALVTKNTQAQLLLIGAIIPMAQTVVGYYYGSSSGSDKKTDLLAGAPPAGASEGPAVVTRTASSSQTITPVAPVVTPVPTPAPTPRT